MRELTNRVSNGPDSFFDSKAVALNGCCNGQWHFITCARGVGRNVSVSTGNFQLNSWDIKKQTGELTNRVSNGPDSFLTARLLLWKDVATVLCVWLPVGGVWEGMAGPGDFQLNGWDIKKRNERTHKLSEQWPWFFFDDKAVAWNDVATVIGN